MMVFKTTIGAEILAAEPTARNSNLFPVKAKGDVLFLSGLYLSANALYAFFIYASVAFLDTPKMA
jgi:hypothetical protein